MPIQIAAILGPLARGLMAGGGWKKMLGTAAGSFAGSYLGNRFGGKSDSGGFDLSKIDFGQVQADFGKVRSAIAKLPPILQKSATSFDKFTTKLSMPIRALGAAFDYVEGTIGKFTATYVQFGNSLAKYAGMADPNRLTRWNLAVDNATAVFGKVLAPSFDATTNGARKFGGILADIQRKVQPLGDAFGRFGNKLVDFLGSFYERIRGVTQFFNQNFSEYGKGLLEFFGSIMKYAAEMNKLIGEFSPTKNMGVTYFVKAVVSSLKTLTDALQFFAAIVERVRIRIFGGANAMPKSADGYAARDASYTGIEEYGKSLIAESFGQGNAPSMLDIEQSQLATLENIDKNIDQLVGLFDGFVTGMGNGAEAAADATTLGAYSFVKRLLMD